MENSIWTQDTYLPSFDTLKEEIKTDVLIIGGGLAGILCAWKLHQAGISYALVEADRICNGITRNTTAKITVHHGLIYEKLLRTYGAERAQMYYQANRKALAEYAALSETYGFDFEYKNNYLYSRISQAELAAEVHALEQLGIPFSFTEDVSLPFPVKGAICMEKQAQFHPLKFASAIAKELNIYEHTRVKEFKGNDVVTEHGRIHASKIVVTTHFPIWNKHGGYFLKMYQDRSYVLALENAAQVNGMYLDASGKGLSLRNQGDYLLLGGGAHRTGKTGTGWENLRNTAGMLYPSAKECAHWAAQDCMTLDGVPYIGQYGKNTPDLYVATGFNKWGMTTAMAAADILTDLIMDKKNPFAACFSPQRRSMHPQLFVNAMESVWNLVTPTAPRCPHLGCALKWNPQERSWDCPCHGSRFDSSGKLLDGPSTDDLHRKR